MLWWENTRLYSEAGHLLSCVALGRLQSVVQLVTFYTVTRFVINIMKHQKNVFLTITRYFKQYN